MDELLTLQCKNCGAPVGFDILKQSYRCPNCGEVSGIRETTDPNHRWKKIEAGDRRRRETRKEAFCCPNCGAAMLFQEGEESETCDFCGSALVRGEFEASEDFPDFIIPFVLTREEAEARLTSWAEDAANRETAEARMILGESARMTGYYLPYKIVRGPVKGRITREQSMREYDCQGFLNGALVNTVRRMDNEVLDAAEPFDLSALKPFEHGYMAGHKVRLSDISPAKAVRRTEKEAAEAFRPEVEKVLQTEGIRISVTGEDLMEIPVLLPFYVLKNRNLLAVVNGQTGRVAVTAGEEEEKRSGLWRVEPLVITLLFTLAMGLFTHFYIPGMVMAAAVTAPVLMIGYENGRYSLIGRVIRKGGDSRAERNGGILKLTEVEESLKNPLDNTPVFLEPEDGREIPVTIHFYSFTRILSILLQSAVLLGLPCLLSLIPAFAMGKPLETLHPEYGAAWYVIAGAVLLIWWIIGIRQDIYDHPLISRIREDGKTVRAGNRKERRFLITDSLFLTGDKKLKWQKLSKEEKKPLIGLMVGALLILGGSIIAILQ